jgi:hypothetical protein
MPDGTSNTVIIGERYWQIRLDGDDWLKSIHAAAFGWQPPDVEGQLAGKQHLGLHDVAALPTGAALTALGIPPELIEIAKRPGSVRRYLLLAINLAILAYLWRRRNDFKKLTED